MKKLDNFNEIQKEVGEVVEFNNLGAGPQKCVILGVTDFADKEYLRIAFDITDGEFKGEFMNRYKNNTYENKKWPNTGYLYRSYKNSAKRFFAAFITSIEKSNSGFKWNFDETKLKGKIFIANFGEEEYLSEDVDENGRHIIKISLKCVETRSLQALNEGKIKIIPLKKLPRNLPQKPQQKTEIADEDLPF